jgi:large subunit ribosomal protein L34e
MAQRVTLRKRQPYNTTSNRRRIVKTPGGRLVYHHIKKQGTSPKCGDCGINLPGVRARIRTRWCVSVKADLLVDPCSASEKIRDHLEAPKDCHESVRWLAVWGLCQGTVRSSSLATRAHPSYSSRPSRILRAFLVEEAKIVKRVIKQQTAKK